MRRQVVKQQTSTGIATFDC